MTALLNRRTLPGADFSSNASDVSLSTEQIVAVVSLLAALVLAVRAWRTRR